LAAQIKRATGLDACLQSGQPGQFDVIADGKLIFSRFDNGLFPEEEDIVKMLTEK
jgi:predicted Rdx family selenoprotein